MEYSGFIYRCSAGESFDSIALTIYGDEKYAARIMEANPDLCGTLVFGGGEEMKLPVVEMPAANEGGRYIASKAPWKE